MARPLASASSEFLQLDDDISKKLDFAVVGRKVRVKAQPKGSKTSTKRASSTSVINKSKNITTTFSSLSGITGIRNTTKAASNNTTTKAKTKSKSRHELTAMEIWKRNVNKNFGKNQVTNKKTKKSSTLSNRNNENHNKQPEIPIPEMTVGVGAGPIVTKSIFVRELFQTAVKKRKHKKSKTSLNLEKSILDESEITDEKLAKGKRPSWEMNMKEIENFITQKGSEKSEGRKTKFLQGVKQKEIPIITEVVNPSYPSDPKDPSESDYENDENDEIEDQQQPQEAITVHSMDSENEANNLGQNSSLILYKESSNEEETTKIVNKPMEVSPPHSVAKVVPPLLRAANMMEMSQYLARVQTYFDQLGYHRDGEPDTTVNTRLSIKHLMNTARALIKLGQPIKCLHALILAVHFTNHIPLVERFPIHFKSKVSGKEYKHVVLGVYVQGHFGALGISRDQGLQDKPTTFARLSELINNFYQCYNQSGHILKELKIGAIITHDPHSMEHITWKMGKISFDMEPEHIETEIEKISKKLRSQMGSACLRGVRLDQYNSGPPLQQRPIPGPVSIGIIRPMDKSANNQLLLERHIHAIRSRSIPAHPLYQMKQKEWKDLQQELSNPGARSRPYKNK